MSRARSEQWGRLHVPACSAVAWNQTPPRGKEAGDGTRVQGLERRNRTTFGLFSRTRWSEVVNPCPIHVATKLVARCIVLLFCSRLMTSPNLPYCPSLTLFVRSPSISLRYAFNSLALRGGHRRLGNQRRRNIWRVTKFIIYFFFMKRKIQSSNLHIFHLFLHIFHQIHHILFFKSKLYCLLWWDSCETQASKIT